MAAAWRQRNSLDMAAAWSPAEEHRPGPDNCIPAPQYSRARLLARAPIRQREPAITDRTQITSDITDDVKDPKQTSSDVTERDTYFEAAKGNPSSSSWSELESKPRQMKAECRAQDSFAFCRGHTQTQQDTSRLTKSTNMSVKLAWDQRWNRRLCDTDISTTTQQSTGVSRMS